ncbi:TetR family transcriptional regulator [Leifsonia sp. LS1]|uniref:TetR/AcrR family transcriptional regulator n=1 Tax=Leifsonia sp. LS1 TaxID=2828483 RepID=UPI001CFD329A|nr:TetR/AcrR family transcriptional regulator [Leifsonia sp. LS1]GIT78420.1 TetR family transcriptional regulator [Leifsonia sp. LS1]
MARAERADVRRNREAIIDAARLAFRRGESDRRFDDFAALAGVGVGTLYRHFPTREALAAAIYRDEVDALGREARRLLDESPPEAALAAFLRSFVHLIGSEPALARTLATHMRDRPDVQAEGADTLGASIVALVDAAVEGGRLLNDLTPGVILAALHGISSSTGRPGWEADAERLIAALVRERT